MSSLNQDQTGRWRLQFRTDRRHTIRLGLITKTSARMIQAHIDMLIERREIGSEIPKATEDWIGNIHPSIRRQLVDMGVIENQGPTSAETLGAFLDWYIKSREDVEPGTRSNYRAVSLHLLRFFEESRRLDSISLGEADRFRIWLSSKAGQSENTVKRVCGRAKQFFRAAKRNRLISENPFEDMRRLVVGPSPEHRVHFVDEATSRQVVAACPDSHWRAIFVLARYGGLRVPSEVCALKWEDIDWDGGTISVPCIKTQHFIGRQRRTTPLFPDVRTALEALRSDALGGVEFVLRRTVSARTNLRTGMIRILKAAGVPVWPKLFQNLRSTRATELRDKGFPSHVVAGWLGHSVTVADKHYSQITEEHLRKALEKPEDRAAS